MGISWDVDKFILTTSKTACYVVFQNSPGEYWYCYVLVQHMVLVVSFQRGQYGNEPTADLGLWSQIYNSSRPVAGRMHC